VFQDPQGIDRTGQSLRISISLMLSFNRSKHESDPCQGCDSISKQQFQKIFRKPFFIKLFVSIDTLLRSQERIEKIVRQSGGWGFPVLGSIVVSLGVYALLWLGGQQLIKSFPVFSRQEPAQASSSSAKTPILGSGIKPEMSGN